MVALNALLTLLIAHLLADYGPPALQAPIGAPLSPPERAQRRSSENPDSALSRTAKRQDSHNEKDSADCKAAARAAFTFLSSERTLGEWRVSLVDISIANASMLIALLLKLFGMRPTVEDVEW